MQPWTTAAPRRPVDSPQGSLSVPAPVPFRLLPPTWPSFPRWEHSVAINSKGHLLAWGAGGTTGQGDGKPRELPERVALEGLDERGRLEPVVARGVVAGQNFTLVLGHASPPPQASG